MKVPDSHAHLLDSRFDADRKEVLHRAIESGVTPVLVPCTTEEFEKALQLFQGDSHVHLAVGIHPHEAREFDTEKRALIERAAEKSLVVAIGEIGLDYHYDFSPRDKQLDALKIQLEVAEKNRLPVIIHSRDSAEEMARIIEKYEVSGVFHSFSEEPWFAEFGVEKGFYISFSGMITFKWADFIREVAWKTPRGKLLVETDSPYLAPVPFRGRRNEPAFVTKVAEKLAEVRGMNIEDLSRVLVNNYFRLFGGEDGKIEEKASRD